MILELITRWFTPAILILGAAHLLFFGLLWVWARRDLVKLADTLDQFTAGIHSRSRLEWTGHISDQIDGFVADVHEALHSPQQRELIRQRMQILDERRTYLSSYRFETAWTVARSAIEAYPLLGVLGTIYALWLAMRGPAGGGGEAAVGEIVSRFGLAIDSTFAGLALAIALMIVNSMLETLFQRLLENRRHIRHLVVEAKRELMAAPSKELEPVVPFASSDDQ